MDNYSWTGAKRELLYRLGNRTDVSNRADTWLNSAQQLMAASEIDLPRLEVVQNPFYVHEDLSEYDVDDQLGEIVGIRLVRNETTEMFMTRFTFEEYRNLSSQSTGSPQRWSRKGNLFVIDPKPDGPYELKIDFRRQPYDQTMEVDNRWQEHLITLANAIGFRALRQYNEFTALFSTLPITFQRSLAEPLDQDMWENLWNMQGLIYK